MNGGSKKHFLLLKGIFIIAFIISIAQFAFYSSKNIMDNHIESNKQIEAKVDSAKKEPAFIPLDSERVDFKHIITTDEGDNGSCSIFWGKDSLYLLYQRGRKADNSYWCDVYALPVSDKLKIGDSSTACSFYDKKFFFRKKIKNIKKITGIKTLENISQYALTDSVTVNKYLKNKRILQMANPDKNNLFVLLLDTTNYECFLIWHKRSQNSCIQYSISDTESYRNVYLYYDMLFADLNGDGQPDLIIKQDGGVDGIEGGGLKVDIYILHLDRSANNPLTPNKK